MTGPTTAASTRVIMLFDFKGFFTQAQRGSIDGPQPHKELFCSWRWKVHDHQPQPPDAMNAGCLDMSAEGCQGGRDQSCRWIIIFTVLFWNSPKTYCNIS